MNSLHSLTVFLAVLVLAGASGAAQGLEHLLRLLQWDPGKDGATLELPFSVKTAGRYRVVARLSRVAEGGTFKLSVDENPLTEGVNLYGPPPFPELFEQTAVEADLAVGKHVLKFISQEPDSKSKGRRLLVDRFRVVPPGQSAAPVIRKHP